MFYGVFSIVKISFRLVKVIPLGLYRESYI